MEEPGGLQSMGSLGVRQDWVTSLSLFTFMHWRRKWQPTPVFLPGESQGRRSQAAIYGVAQSRTRLKWLSSGSSSIQTFVSKVMSLLFKVTSLLFKVMSLFFNTLSRFVIAFLPRNKHLSFMTAVTIHSDFGLFHITSLNKSLKIYVRKKLF